MKVKIHSNFEGMSWEGDVPDELLTSPDVNETLFRLFNRVDIEDVLRLEAWGYHLPSLSVNDLLEHSNRMWRVAATGFDLVEA